MDDESMSKIELEALVSEASRLGGAIAERLSAAERFVAVAGTFSGIGLTLGFIQRQKVVLIGLPLVISIIIVYMIQIYTDASMNSGYRSAVETRLEMKFGRRVLVGQSHVASGYGRRRSVVFVFGLVAVLWVGTVVLGYLAIGSMPMSTEIRVWSNIGYSLSVLAALTGIIFASYENANAEEWAMRKAAKAWDALVLNDGTRHD